MPSLVPPYFPIIYVRGYAMRDSDIAETVATPFMGFNLGATKVRQSWDRKVLRHIFESPLVRLMKDYNYSDIYDNGTEITGPLSARSVVVYRYYEEADTDIGKGEVPSIVEAAKGLRTLIHQIRDQVCGEDWELRNIFRVNLVAHSMGGLVVRCFLQNDEISTSDDRELVNKVFTYATPHNGIELAGTNKLTALGMRGVNNFNRRTMAKYLDLAGQPERVDALDGKFDPQRFFCFVGTNHRDYGLVRWLAGEMSDGLVKIENATVQDSPRAFAYRSHSGPYGVVNSEEGYQNLVRFLFGDLRVDGVLEVENLPLPPSVQAAKANGEQVRASYYFEATVSVRALDCSLTERRRGTFSAVLRRYDELFQSGSPLGPDRARSPVLFSAFLDTRNISVGRTVVFGLDLAVSTTDYTIGNKRWLKQKVEGEYLFRDTITVRATQTRDGYNVYFVSTDEHWSENKGASIDREDDYYKIPLKSKKGFEATLRLAVQHVPAMVHEPAAARSP